MGSTLQDAGSLACKIGVLSRQITTAAARLLAPLDVTPGQANVFYYLLQGESSPSAIARGMGVDASTLSRMLGTLEKRGCITRSIDPSNRTRISLALTEEGRQLALRSDPHAAQIQERILSVLEDGELEILQRALGAISSAMAPEKDVPLE